jgi:TolB-like protein/Flp pilus assembly protein TadD
VENKLAFGLEPMGEQKMKNIAEPIEVYRVRLDGSGGPCGRMLSTRPGWRWSIGLVGAAMVLTLAAGAGVMVKFWVPRFEPDLPLPDKPSVAVMPFTNMSGDPQQVYFADGVTDDLITDLSKMPGLFVISRNSSFTYKDRSVDPRQVAKELGVRYVLEGSIQRSAVQVRINAQLVDAVSNGDVWADRFDGSPTDVFALQDRVTHSIADALALRLTPTFENELAKKETDIPAAYDAFLRGLEHLRRRTPDEFSQAIPLLEQAVKLDPEYGRAYAALAWVYVVSYQRKWFDVIQTSDVEARIKAKRYLAEAQKHPTALSRQVAGQMLATDGDYEGAVAEFKDAIARDPGDAVSFISMADALTSFGRAAEALPLIATAMRLDPHYPSYFLSSLGMAHYVLEQFKDAAVAFEEAARRDPDDATPLLWLAATYGHLGRKQDAMAIVAQYNQLAVKHGGVPVAKIVMAEGAATESRPLTNLKARDLLARAHVRIIDQTSEATAEASDLVENAIRLDPMNPVAHRVRAWVFFTRIWLGEIPNDPTNRSRAFELARTALRLSPLDEYAHLTMAWAWAYAGEDLEEAISECERGLEINPSCAILYGNVGAYLAALGRPEEAIEVCRLSLRLDPRNPTNFWRQHALAVAYFVAANYPASLKEGKSIARSRSHLPSAILWAASAAALGKTEEARAAVEECLAKRPNLRADGAVPGMLRFAREADRERLQGLLRKAGLPE